MKYSCNTLDNKVKIKYENICKNIEIVKNYNSKKNIIAVIKNDAYNLGINEVAKTCYASGVNFFAVANLTEALKVYELGLDSKILILNPLNFKEFEVANKLQFHVIINSLSALYEYIEWINDLLLKNEQIKINFHLKINSGMNRYGLKFEEISQAIEIINSNTNIKVNLVGLMTHFARADEDNKNLHNNEVDLFVEALEVLKKHYSFKYIHSENSAAFLLADKRLDICNYARIGILLYGYKPMCFDINLYPTMYLTSKISHINVLKESDFLGYGEFKVLQDCKIGVCTIGYGDGLINDRKSYPVFINGKKYDILGNISMSHTYVVIDDMIQVGDEVEIYGENIRFDDIKGVTNSRMMCSLKRC